MDIHIHGKPVSNRKECHVVSHVVTHTTNAGKLFRKNLGFQRQSIQKSTDEAFKDFLFVVFVDGRLGDSMTNQIQFHISIVIFDF